jgi:hypothetical protein
MDCGMAQVVGMTTTDHEYAGISRSFYFLVTHHVFPLYSEYNQWKTLSLYSNQLSAFVCVFILIRFVSIGIKAWFLHRRHDISVAI